MKEIIITLFVTCVIDTVCAQTNNAKDSIYKQISLNEVVVNSSAVSHRNGKDIYIPTVKQRELSSNGISLLDKLHLNGLQVNALFNTVSYAGGGNVAYCINGRVVELQDLLSISPDQVAHVEYDENPSARFKGSAVVINFKLRKPLQGGRYMHDIMEAVNTIYGVNHISGSYNYGKSEWKASYNNLFASFKDFYNHSQETYHVGTDSMLTQYESGIPGKLRYDNHWLDLSYNYQVENKWMLNIALRGKYNNQRRVDLNSWLTCNAMAGDSAYLQNHSSQYERTTALDIYLQRTLGHGQNLYFDIIGTYMNTSNSLYYNISGNNINLFSNSNSVKGNKYSLIGEALYEKEFDNDRFTIGMRHTIGLARNDYYGDDFSQNRLHHSDSYIYVEWFHKIKNFNYALGAGLEYVRFKQEKVGYDNISFRPTIRLNYSPCDEINFKYSGNIEKVTPSLAELSNVSQTIDNYQIRRGNPQLHPATDFNNKLTVSYNHRQWSGNINLTYQYRCNPIMENTYLDNGKYIRGFANQNSWQYFNAEYNIISRWLGGIITARATAGVDYFDSRALDYHHSFSNCYASVFFEAAYKCVAFTFNLRTHRPRLYGETLTLGEDLHDIAITYYKKKFTICMAMNNPFMNNYRVGTECWNKKAPNIAHQFVNETSRMALLKFTGNFDFGKKHNTGEQRLHNEDKDSGVLKTGK